MKQYQSKHTAALSTRGFYTILSLCALIIAASAWVIWGNAHRQNAVEPDTGMPIIAITCCENPTSVEKFHCHSKNFRLYFCVNIEYMSFKIVVKLQ